MSSSEILIRARFADGEVWTLPPLDGTTTTLQELEDKIRCHRKWDDNPSLVLAGPPPKPLSALSPTLLKSLIPTPTAVILVRDEVSRTSNVPGNSNTTAQPNNSRARSTHNPSRKQKSSVKTLSDLNSSSRQKRLRSVDDVDDNDDGSDWDATQAQCHDEDSDDIDGNNSTQKRTGRMRRGRGGGHQHVSSAARDAKRPRTCSKAVVEEPAKVLISEDQSEVGRDDAGDLSLIAVDVGVPQIEGQLGVMLAQSLLDVDGKQDSKVSLELRKNFSDALKKRQMEAEGERRLSAFFAKRYVITEQSRGSLFRVRYRAVSVRKWTDENDGRTLVTYPKVLLTEVVRVIVHNDKDKMKLQPIVMAAVSPRMFWNLARLFPDDLEAGLKSLVPDADWSFLTERERILSIRGKQNLENKREMGWNSD